jgi:hypothetical protein
MMTKTSLLYAAAAFAAAASMGAAADAATLYAAPAATGPMATDQSYSDTFSAPAGPANLSFVIDGYNSLDGQNSYEDDFTLSVNGAAIVSGTFNLGGGGTDAVFFAPAGATVDNVSGNGTNITWSGGSVNVSAPIDLVSGTNTLSFSYASRAGGGYAGFQGLADEGWGIEKVSVTSAVPEPGAWALMLVGFGALGFALRRSRGRVALAL